MKTKPNAGEGEAKAVRRHPLAVGWDYWLASDEGQKAANINTLLASREAGLYLANRLRTAFLEGAKARDVLCGNCGRRYVGPYEEDPAWTERL